MLHSKIHKPFIIKIEIKIPFLITLPDLMKKRRLPTPPDSGNNNNILNLKIMLRELTSDKLITPSKPLLVQNDIS